MRCRFIQRKFSSVLPGNSVISSIRCPCSACFVRLLFSSALFTEMSNQTMENVEEDIWARATKAADELYQLKDTFFPANPDDKVAKLQNESDLALKLLDSVPPGNFSAFSIFITY